MKRTNLRVFTCLLMAALSCLPVLGFAQVQCAGGAALVAANGDSSSFTTQFFPGHGFYKYSYTEVIVPAERVGTLGEIKAMQFFPTSGNTNGTRYTNCKIYLGHTSRENLSSGFIQDLSSFELVYTGSLNYTAGEWKTVVFDESFFYDGESNLVVAIQRNTGSYGSNGKTFLAYNAGAVLGRNVQADGSAYTVGAISGGSTATTVPVYRFLGCPPMPENCARVTDLEVSAVSDASALLSWQDTATLNAGAAYLVFSADTLFASGISTTQYTLSGLSPNTEYVFEVAAVCTSGDTSRRRSVRFRTQCGAMGLPYGEDFNTLSADALPLCWTHLTPGSGNHNQLGGSSTNPAGGTGMCLRFNYSRPTGNIVALPPMALPLSSTQILFSARPESNSNPGCGTLYVGYLTVPADSASFVAVDSVRYNDFSTSDYEDFEVSFATAPAGAVAAFCHKGLNSNWYMNVDNVVVEEIPSCPKVDALTVLSTSTDGATLSWTYPSGSALSFFIVDAETGEVLTEEIEDTTVYELTGLEANRRYTVAVVAVCAGADTSAGRTVSFRTNCPDLQTLPYAEDFEGMALRSHPECWQRVREYFSSAEYVYPFVYNNAPHGGAAAYYMYYQNLSTTPNGPQVGATPPLDAPVNSLHVSFWAKFSSAVVDNVLEAGVMMDATDPTSFYPVLRVDGSEAGNTYGQYEFYTDGVPATTIGRVAFRWTSTNNANLSIDDIYIEEAGDCRLPIHVSVSDVDYEGATLRWEDNGNPDYAHVVCISRTNNPNASTAQIDTTAGSSYTFSGLSANTTYYVFVSTLCGENQTEWTSAVSFTTQRNCYPVVQPTVSTVTLTSAVVEWSFEEGAGREPSSVSITLTDASNPSQSRVYNVQGTTALLGGLEPSHTYLASIVTRCGDFSSTAAAVSFSTLDCGKVEGTMSQQYGAFNGYNSYGYSQTLYPASLVESIDSIEGLQFYIKSANSTVPTRTVDIYMANTELSDLDTNRYLDINDLTLVAENASLSVNSIGWKTIHFDAPFVNQRGSNVVVAVVNKTGQGASFMWRCHAAEYGSMACWNSSTSAINLQQPRQSGSGLSAGRYDWVADISFLGTCDLSGCRAPMAAVTERQTDGLTVAWIPAERSNSWILQYRRTASPSWTDTIAVSDTVFSLSGLLPAHSYTLRVGEVCGGDTLFCAPIEVFTDCAEPQFPYYEGFEEWTAAHFHDCWKRVLTYTQSNVSYPVVSELSGNAHSGSKSVDFYGSSSNMNMIVGPAIDLPADSIHVEFWAKLGQFNTAHVLEAGLMTDPTDASTFVAMKSVSGTLSNTEWQMHDFYTSSMEQVDGPVYVAFRYRTTGSNFHLFLDDVMIARSSECERPEEGGIEGISYHDASLHWEGGASAAQNYRVRLTQEYDVMQSGAIETLSADTVCTVGDLDFGTLYHAWVSAECAQSSSDWLYLGSFTTDERCMPASELRVGSTDFSTATLSWEYDTVRGIGATGAHIYVRPLEDEEAPVLTFISGGRGALLTDLEPGTTYKAWIVSECGTDTARIMPSVVFTTRTCAVAEGPTGGTPSYTFQIPFREYNTRNSYMQSVYPDTVLHGMDSIRGIAFRVHSGAEGNTHEMLFDVYIGSTTRTSVNMNSYVRASAMERVVTDRRQLFDREGWIAIPFDTVFAPAEDSNVVLTVVNKTGTADNKYLYWTYHSAASQSTLHYYNNTSTAINPDVLTGGSQQTFAYVPDVMFIGDCNYNCHAPAVVVDDVSAESIGITWTASDGESQWMVGIRGENGEWQDQTVGDNTYSFTELLHSTQYTFRVGSFCTDENGEVEDTLFTEVSAYTLCGAVEVPYEPVLTQALGPCWYVSHEGSVYAETSTGTLYMASPYYYAVLPELSQDLSEVQLKMNFSLSNTSYSIMIGATEEGGGSITWIDTLRVQTAHTPVETVTHFIGYTGSGRRIVIANGSGTYYTRISSIQVQPLEECFPVDSLKVYTSVGSAEVEWSYGVEEAMYMVQYKSSAAYVWDSVLVDSTSVRIWGLEPSTQYSVRVKAQCTSETEARWTETTFTTPCAAEEMPYVEDFSVLGGNSSLTQSLGCWDFYEGVYDSVVSGREELQPMSGYRWSAANGTIDGLGLRLEIYGNLTHVHHWAVAPAVAVDDSEALIAFDYSITLSGNAPDADDRVLLLGTTDGGRHWRELALWGSDAERDTFALSGLYNTPIHVELPLEDFFGDTLRIAFYGQSSATGSDFYFNIDNLRIGHRLCPQPNIDSVRTSGSNVSVYFTAEEPAEVHICLGDWEAPANGTPTEEGEYTFSMLAPGVYTVGVRQLCDADNYSEWTLRTVDTRVYYTLNVLPNDTTMGMVIGAGVYEQGSLATIAAVAKAGYSFYQWSDNLSTEAIRVLTVSSDSTIVAVFVPEVGVPEVAERQSIGLYPNPASGRVRIGVEEEVEKGMIEVVDISGSLIERRPFSGREMELNVEGYSEGTYFVRLVSERGTCVGKLVVR